MGGSPVKPQLLSPSLASPLVFSLWLSFLWLGPSTSECCLTCLLPGFFANWVFLFQFAHLRGSRSFSRSILLQTCLLPLYSTASSHVSECCSHRGVIILFLNYISFLLMLQISNCHSHTSCRQLKIEWYIFCTNEIIFNSNSVFTGLHQTGFKLVDLAIKWFRVALTVDFRPVLNAVLWTGSMNGLNLSLEWGNEGFKVMNNQLTYNLHMC